MTAQTATCAAGLGGTEVKLQFLKEIFISILIGAIIASMIIFPTVNAFAAELPDIEEPCGLTAEELEERLKGNLKPYAQAFLHAEEDYEINALFLCAVAAAESAWGRRCFRPNNIFGYMTNRKFSSIPENIDFVAWKLKKNYLNKNGKYYRGGTIEAIGKIWCPDGGEWVRLVAGIYGGLCK